MCGIAGLSSLSLSIEQHLSLAQKMHQSIIHRGPDAFGVWHDNDTPLCLAHRRLSIHDLSENGAQPMASQTERYVIVYNGEVYNFTEIQKQLLSLGYSFKGGSDTEVILAAIEEWGVKQAITRFSGMFAIALWDKREKELVLCRDRLGEKPLYYGYLNGVLFFASELKSIEQLASIINLDVDINSIRSFLKYGYVNEPYSIYHGIYKLPPGSLLKLKIENTNELAQLSPVANSSSISPQRYWDKLDVANESVANQIDDEEECQRLLERQLLTVVERQLSADVPLGAFLSGGVDSTLVCALAQSISHQPVKTYTLGFEEKQYDESVYAGKIAAHLGTNHHVLQMSSHDALEAIPTISSIYDEPFSDSSNIPSYLISKLAREHVTVCLSGDGGDELFAGYNRYISLNNIWDKAEKIPHFLRKAAGSALGVPSIGFWDLLYSVVGKKGEMEKRKLVGLKMQKLSQMLQCGDVLAAYDFLLSYWWDDTILQGDHLNFKSSKPECFLDDDEFINKAMFWDQQSYLVSDNLVKVDRASMAASLETRLPLLDHKVFELSWRIPLKYKISQGKNKTILRNILYKYVPEQLIERPKMGFSVPIGEWLKSDLREWAEDHFAMLVKDKYQQINSKMVSEHWKNHLSGNQDNSHKLWSILMYISWREARSN